MSNQPNEKRNIADTLISFENSIDAITINNDFNDNNSQINAKLKKRIDKLNRLFYSETEKCMETNQAEDKERSHNKLFLILFRQINIYIEEVNRLNVIISNMREAIYSIAVINGHKRSKNHLNSQQRKLEIKEACDCHKTMLKLSESNQILQKRLNESQTNEEERRIEIDSLKRQVFFYKDKLKLNIGNKTNEVASIKLVPALDRKFYSPNRKENQSYEVNTNNLPLNLSTKNLINKRSYAHQDLKKPSSTLKIKSLIYKGIDSEEMIKGNEELRKMIKTPFNQQQSTIKTKQNESKTNDDYRAMLKHIDNEITDLSTFEQWLINKRNALTNESKTIDTNISLNETSEITSEDLSKKSIKSKGNKIIQFPIFTSVKIDL